MGEAHAELDPSDVDADEPVLPVEVADAATLVELRADVVVDVAEVEAVVADPVAVLVVEVPLFAGA